jgi:Glycosyl hydrolase family 45
MVFSAEFKQAAADDWASGDPPFVYGVVGHDKDTGALDTESGNTCCQCYQLVFTTPKDPVSGVAAPKPMIVQAFNTAAGGAKNFDIYMAMGGYGSNTAGCPAMYSQLPTVGEPNNGGVRVENASECRASNGQFTAASVSSAACQDAVAAQCTMIQSTASPSNQAESQVSCVEANQPDSLYHMNWNVLARRVECPTNLTRVTGCKLGSQGLPAPDPTAKDAASAGSGFSSGYGTTTMQDCCRPTCAYSANVMMSGVAVDASYGAFYTCDAAGNPS